MINKKLGLMALLAGCAVGKIVAGDFNAGYAVGDVLVCFRNGSTYDLVVDAGPISSLTTSASPNQRIPITQYSVGQFDTAFGSANSVTWSAYTWLSDNTLYVTRARPSLNTQSSPFPRKSSGSQSFVVADAAAVPKGAVNQYGYNGNTSATAVLEPDNNSSYTSGTSYEEAVNGSYGSDFNGTFSGNPENVTPGSFTTSGTVQRSDFYQMSPGSGNGTYVGYFEMATDGSLTYVAYPSTIPVIKSISRSGNVSTINYTAGLYGTYTLRGTNTLSSGVSPANWPAVATLTDASPSTVQQYLDTDSGNTKFYFITAQ